MAELTPPERPLIKTDDHGRADWIERVVLQFAVPLLVALIAATVSPLFAWKLWALGPLLFALSALLVVGFIVGREGPRWATVKKILGKTALTVMAASLIAALLGLIVGWYFFGRGDKATPTRIQFVPAAWFVAWNRKDLMLANGVVPHSFGHKALVLNLMSLDGKNPAAAMPAPSSLSTRVTITYQVWAPQRTPRSLTVTPFAIEKNSEPVSYGRSTSVLPGQNYVTFIWPFSGSGYQMGLEVEGMPVGWRGSLYLISISQ